MENPQWVGKTPGNLLSFIKTKQDKIKKKPNKPLFHIYCGSFWVRLYFGTVIMDQVTFTSYRPQNDLFIADKLWFNRCLKKSKAFTIKMRSPKEKISLPQNLRLAVCYLCPNAKQEIAMANLNFSGFKQVLQEVCQVKAFKEFYWKSSAEVASCSMDNMPNNFTAYSYSKRVES